MTNKGRNVEVEMVLDINVEEIGGRWYVTSCGERLTKGVSGKDIAAVQQKMFCFAYPIITKIFSDAIEDYFKELEKP